MSLPQNKLQKFQQLPQSDLAPGHLSFSLRSYSQDQREAPELRVTESVLGLGLVLGILPGWWASPLSPLPRLPPTSEPRPLVRPSRCRFQPVTVPRAPDSGSSHLSALPKGAGFLPLPVKSHSPPPPPPPLPSQTVLSLAAPLLGPLPLWVFSQAPLLVCLLFICVSVSLLTWET